MANNKTIVPFSLDDYFQSTPIGSVDKAIGNNLYGINHRQIAGAVPSNKDIYGLTFFVRPQLNMQGDNIRNVRKFSPLLTDNSLSMQRFVRATLDPRLLTGYTFNKYKVPPITCPVVDNMQAFIPILTNNINSISGWPDVVVNPFTSKPGIYQEVYSQVDSKVDNYEAIDLDVSFRNTHGDPILYLFYIWCHYSSYVFEGTLIPYLDFITENEIDYNTRIYRLVLDHKREVVKKIAATGVSFPISVPTGSFFDYNNDKPYNDQNKDITIRFRSLGVIYQDDILIKEFNKTVAIFNPYMNDEHRAARMVKIPQSLVHLFNNRGYPRINPNNNVLEWWVHQDYYNNRTNAFLKATLLDKESVDDSDNSGD